MVSNAGTQTKNSQKYVPNSRVIVEGANTDIEEMNPYANTYASSMPCGVMIGVRASYTCQGAWMNYLERG